MKVRRPRSQARHSASVPPVLTKGHCHLSGRFTSILKGPDTAQPLRLALRPARDTAVAAASAVGSQPDRL